MTVAEMHIMFKFGLDKFDSLNYPDFEPLEIDLLLNQAQDSLVKQRYGINNIKRQSFEETQKRIDDLKNIVTTANLTPLVSTINNKPNGVFVNLPTVPLYWFAIQEEALITYKDCNSSETTKRTPVKVIQHDDYNEIINDPFNKPYIDKILRLEENSRFELIGDGTYTIDTYILRYIRRPVRIDLQNNINCELSEHLHQEIVNTAIQIALEGIESQRQQSFNIIKNNEE